jgi:hypothetical protein
MTQLRILCGINAPVTRERAVVLFAALRRALGMPPK